MEMLGDRAEFARRGRPRGARDRRPRRRRNEGGIAAATLGGGGVLGAGAAGVVRERAYRQYAKPVVRQVTREYRQATGKRPSARKIREVKSLARESFGRVTKDQADWGKAAKEFNFDVGRRKQSPFPKMPWQYAKGRPFIIEKGPVKPQLFKMGQTMAMARPARIGGAAGLAVGALAYGAYRGSRALNNRRR